MNFVVTTHSADLIANAEETNLILLYGENFEILDAGDFSSISQVYDIFSVFFEKKEKNDKEKRDELLRRLLNWLLDLPGFLPEYEDGMNYGYKNKPGKNLETLLRETSNNHCMYCYSLLKNDRVNIGHLEHSIEKKLDEEHLTECTPNIAIACPNCNLSLKRVGEQNCLSSKIYNNSWFIICKDLSNQRLVSNGTFDKFPGRSGMFLSFFRYFF